MPKTAKQKEIKLRRDLVRRLALRKLTIREIALKVNVNEKTVDRDLEVIRKENNNTIQQSIEKQGEYQQVVQEHLFAKDEIVRELWLNYHKENLSTKTKVNTLKALSGIYNEKLGVLQNLGLVQKEPFKIRTEELEGVNGRGDADKATLNREFTEFIKRKYQDPLH